MDLRDLSVEPQPYTERGTAARCRKPWAPSECSGPRFSKKDRRGAERRRRRKCIARLKRRDLRLIRFGGHLPKGGYDVDHGGQEAEADTTQLHR